MQPDRLLIRQPGARPHPRSLVFEPPLEELSESLTLVWKVRVSRSANSTRAPHEVGADCPCADGWRCAPTAPAPVITGDAFLPASWEYGV